LKTSEMFAMLEKNPKLTLVCRKGGNEYFMTTETVFSMYYKSYAKRDGQIITHQAGHFFGNISFDDDWQIVREPVTWQEALQAMIEGKNVLCKCANCTGKIVLKTNPSSQCVYPADGNICINAFKSGTWYIGDHDHE